jgi:hypothetical protein
MNGSEGDRDKRKEAGGGLSRESRKDPTSLSLSSQRAIASLGFMLIAVMTGCASGRRLAHFDVGADPAQITIMRLSTFGAGQTVPIVIDDRVVARVGVREFVRVAVPAGEHIVAIPRGSEGAGVAGLFQSGHNYLPVAVRPGEEIYILMEHNFWEMDPRLYPPGLGRLEIQNLKEIK